MSLPELVIQAIEQPPLVIEVLDEGAEVMETLPLPAVEIIEVRIPGPPGPPGPGAAEYFTFFYGGPLEAVNGIGHDIVMEPGIIDSVRLRVDEAPQGSDLIVRIEIGGVEIALAAVPEGQFAGATLGLTQSVGVGADVTVDIVEVGSDYPGSTLTVKVKKSYQGG